MIGWGHKKRIEIYSIDSQILQVIELIHDTLKIATELYDKGVYVNTVLPPAAPADGCMLRCSIMATHTKALLDEAMDVIADVVKSHE